MFLFTVLVLAAAFAIWRMSRPIEAPNKRVKPRLQVTLNPVAQLQVSPVWMLSRDLTCPNTSKLNPGPVAAEKAQNLETLGCGPGRCHCHYTALPDRRRRVRRDQSERRDEIRFAAQPDRRADSRRHNERLWATPGYQR